METFFLEPDLFDTYIAFDPSLWWNNNELVNRADSRLRASGNRRRTLYFVTSEKKELLNLTKRLATILGTTTPSGLTWHLEHMPNESHATIYHPAALHALRRLFKPRPDSSATP